MVLPEYINCNRKGEIVHCDYLLTDDCPSTCAYAKDIGRLGIGAPVIPLGLENIIDGDKLNDGK